MMPTHLSLAIQYFAAKFVVLVSQFIVRVKKHEDLGSAVNSQIRVFLDHRLKYAY